MSWPRRKSRRSRPQTTILAFSVLPPESVLYTCLRSHSQTLSRANIRRHHVHRELATAQSIEHVVCRRSARRIPCGCVTVSEEVLRTRRLPLHGQLYDCGGQPGLIIVLITIVNQHGIGQLGFELVDLAHQIKADKKCAGFGGCRAIREHAAGRSPLRCGDPRCVCETERESMTEKLLLDAEGVRRTVDSQRRAIDKCRSEFRYQCDSRPHIESAAETNGKGIVAGKAGNL